MPLPISKMKKRYFTKGNSKAVSQNNIITSSNFEYDKNKNIIKATGNVKFIDEIENITITSNTATYFKNEEKILTKGNSKAVSQNNIITGSNFEYDKIRNIIKATGNVKFIDEIENITITSNTATYFKNEGKDTYQR